ncbi:hypothetical protein STEG23_024287 [Scotinomys teguina]
MAALPALLPKLGLFLCLALRFSPAFSASYNDPCMVFDTVSTSDNSGISTKAEVSGGNRTYTVFVPVNSSISFVILKAVNRNNTPVGSWIGPAQECNDSSVLYRMTPSNSSNFQATWMAPDSEDVTEINLQVSIITDNRTAIMMSPVRLEQITTPAPLTPTPKNFETSQTTSMTSAKSQTTAKTTAKTVAKTSAMTSAMTSAKTSAMTSAKTTARSLAVNALSSPLAGAFHILLVFLISKLLF